MTPTRATKKTKRYRYYVSASLLACPQAQKGMRVTASDMEGLVLERLRGFLVQDQHRCAPHLPENAVALGLWAQHVERTVSGVVSIKRALVDRGQVAG